MFLLGKTGVRMRFRTSWGFNKIISVMRVAYRMHLDVSFFPLRGVPAAPGVFESLSHAP